MGKVKARGAGVLGPPGLPGGDWLKARLTIEQNPALVMCPHLFCLTSFYAVSSPYDDRIQCPLDIRMSLYTLCWIWCGHVTKCNHNLHWSYERICTDHKTGDRSNLRLQPSSCPLFELQLIAPLSRKKTQLENPNYLILQFLAGGPLGKLLAPEACFLRPLCLWQSNCMTHAIGLD